MWQTPPRHHFYTKTVGGIFENTTALRLVLVGENFDDILFLKIKNMAKVSMTIPIISDKDFGGHYSDYLKHSEFQISSRKQKIYIPSQPCIGFSERLNCYFWPTPNKNPNLPIKESEKSFMNSVQAAGPDAVIVKKPDGTQEVMPLVQSNNPDYVARRAEALRKPRAVLGQATVQ